MSDNTIETIEEEGLPVCPVNARKIKDRVLSVEENSWGFAVMCPLCLNYNVFNDAEELFSLRFRNVCSCGHELDKKTSKYELFRIRSIFVWDEEPV